MAAHGVAVHHVRIGLIRLTESERARRSSSLVLALIGTVGALIAIRFLPSALLSQAGIWEKHEADVLAFGVGTTVSMLLVVVLWRYFTTAGRSRTFRRSLVRLSHDAGPGQ